MSLDIYLKQSECETCGRGDEVHWQNITHNLGAMAEEAGIYQLLWHPKENNVTSAADLIEPLEQAIAAMKNDPARFECHNSPNGWGLYKHFVPWLERLLEACKENPDACVSASI